MAYYKKQKLNGKWYPRSVTVGTLTTADVAERLSRMSTVTRGDVYAVLLGLGEVMGEMLAMGSSVKLDGLGTFYLVGKAVGAGVDTPQEVSPRQFRKLSVAFIPEYSRTSSHAVVARTIVPRQVQWVSRDRTSE
ncbi:HU family DNA-binding protein [Phocaeicola coprophilus]|nr:HU family DNA-binding protein [Phocaeicola coprophilus]